MDIDSEPENPHMPPWSIKGIDQAAIWLCRLAALGKRARIMVREQPAEIRDGFIEHLQEGGPTERSAADALLEAYATIDRMRAALLIGIALCENGGHGKGKKCPTCHFMRAAQKALDD